MKMFLGNVVLALVWAFAVGDFTITNFVVGFVLAYLVLGFVHQVVGPSHYHAKSRQVVRFALFYLWQLLLANLRVAYDVLTPAHHMRPAIIAVPLDARTEEEITLLANLITLTPGSLSLDVSEDRRLLYVHVMYLDDPDQNRQRIKDHFEKPVLELLR